MERAHHQFCSQCNYSAYGSVTTTGYHYYHSIDPVFITFLCFVKFLFINFLFNNSVTGLDEHTGFSGSLSLYFILRLYSFIVVFQFILHSWLIT